MDRESRFRLDSLDATGVDAKAVGLERQAMAADLVTRGDGWERGVRTVLLQNDRISIEVILDRGIDIGAARIHQIPIAWRSPTEIVAPWFVENDGFGPHRGFFGGLLTTCGLDHIGPPTARSAERFGYGARTSELLPMHGRYSGSPGRLIGYGVREKNSGLEAFVEGGVSQVAVFGEHLTLRRRVTIRYGSSQIRIEDEVINNGYATSPLAVMYHVNAGWPIVAPGARITVSGSLLRGEGNGSVVSAPLANRPERTWMYSVQADARGRGNASIVNNRISNSDAAGLKLEWDPASLPTLVQWELAHVAGHYAVGLEPSTINPSGVDEDVPFPTLEPGQAKHLGLSIELLHRVFGGDEAVDLLELDRNSWPEA